MERNRQYIWEVNMRQNLVILYRKYEAEYEITELSAMRKNFDTTCLITNIKNDDLVIGRYSVLPFYKEQEDNVKSVGAKLINSYDEHRYVANMGNWYEDLKEITPKSWPGIEWIDEEGPYVLKGETNSRRQKWSSHMFANSIDDAKKVFNKLSEDSLLSNQVIWIRKFEKLKNHGFQVNGMPISDEYRFFVCDGQILSGGFYWTSCVEDIQTIPDNKSVPRDFLKKAVSLVDRKIRFYTIDVAQKENGEWIVIELNDGQMSGLSENDPYVVFGNLKKVLSGEKSDFY